MGGDKPLSYGKNFSRVFHGSRALMVQAPATGEVFTQGPKNAQDGCSRPKHSDYPPRFDAFNGLIFLSLGALA